MNDALTGDSFFSQVRLMTAAFLSSRQRNRLLLLAAALIAVVGATAYLQIQLNAWNRPFYDSLARKHLPAFFTQLGVFGLLAGLLLILNVAQLWLNQSSKVILREGLVNDLMTEWLKPMRAFHLSNAGDIGANPDQRVHEDAKHLTELSTDLGIGLLQSTLLLMSFIGVLWKLSQDTTLSIVGHVFVLPGYMVWCALLYAGAASFLSWQVGRPLINLNARRYAQEAELRSALVRINEWLENITLYGGEANEKKHLGSVFENLLAASWRIVGAASRLGWVTSGYGWFTIIAPILVAMPIYFHGTMSFGELMMVIGAFNQVQQSLRWFVDNFSTIADWRATLMRIASFRRALLAMDHLGQAGSHIQMEEDGESIRFEDLRISTATDCLSLSEMNIEVKPSERVMVVAENEANKSLLFRAIAGLWPWGCGRIVHPPRSSMMFIPSRAYMPPGTLRAAIVYPQSNLEFDDAAIAKAFTDLGIERLLPALDKSDRWDRLNDDEKQCLAFVRAILQKPRWLVLDDAFALMGTASRSRVQTVIKNHLGYAGIIYLGEEGLNGLFTRHLHLLADPNGPCFDLQAVSRSRPAENFATAPTIDDANVFSLKRKN